MYTNSFNLYALFYLKANFILTSIALLMTLIGIFLTIKAVQKAGISIVKSIETYSYNTWRTIYQDINNQPKILKFFSFEKDKTINIKMLTAFLTMLDMYAVKYADDYTKLSKDKTILTKVFQSPTSLLYWDKCKECFYSNNKFIREIEKIILQNSKQKGV